MQWALMLKAQGPSLDQHCSQAVVGQTPDVQLETSAGLRAISLEPSQPAPQACAGAQKKEASGSNTWRAAIRKNFTEKPLAKSPYLFNMLFVNTLGKKMGFPRQGAELAGT